MKTLDEVAASLQGYDPQALRIDTALAFLQALAAPPQESQLVPLKEALGRVLAQDCLCPIDVPAHDNSAMDGYAFAGAALNLDRALQLTIVGTVLAGQLWSSPVAAGCCVKIMTGAVMPEGCDTVVPQELTMLEGQSITIPPATLRTGENRRLRGEDLQRGSVALHAGERLASAQLGLLASLGISQVRVYRALRVAYFSTGDEIASLGDTLPSGAVYDSNRYTLYGLLQRLGVEAIDLGLIKDEPQALEDAFTHAARVADVVITSGGVSVGEADHTKAVMRKLTATQHHHPLNPTITSSSPTPTPTPDSKQPASGELVFWKIAMRPGRPMAAGRLGDSVLFGLPGNPVAVMVTFLALVRPTLLRMMGSSESSAPLLQAHAAHAIRKKPGRTEYQRAIVGYGADGSLQVKTTGQQGSGVLSSMAQANGLLVLHHDQGEVLAGDRVDVLMLEGLV